MSQFIQIPLWNEQVIFIFSCTYRLPSPTLHEAISRLFSTAHKLFNIFCWNAVLCIIMLLKYELCSLNSVLKGSDNGIYYTWTKLDNLICSLYFAYILCSVEKVFIYLQPASKLTLQSMPWRILYTVLLSTQFPT